MPAPTPLSIDDMNVRKRRPAPRRSKSTANWGKQLQLRLPPPVIDAIKFAALKEKQSISEYMLDCFRLRQKGR